MIDVETAEIGWKLQDFVIDWNNESETIEESTQNTSTKVQVYPWAMQTLTMRRKRQRLSVPEKLHIYKLIVDQNVPLKDVVWNFNISATTVRNIIKNVKNHNSHPEKMHTNTKLSLISSLFIQNLIETFIFHDHIPKTVNDVWNFIYKESEVRVPIHLARSYLKENLRLSYKIGKSRLAKVDVDKNVLIKSYFAIKISQLLSQIDFVENIDEAWFSRNLTRKRSWFRKGSEDIVTNIKYSGSVSLISWIISSGSTFNATVSGSINSKIFVEHLNKLMKFLLKNEWSKPNRILILLDNASSHRSQIAKDFLKSCGMHIAFIPPYSPELAPVEKYFALLKNKACKDNDYASLNWKSKEGTALIAKSIRKIDPPTVKRIWRSFLKEIQNWLDSLYYLI